MFSLINYVNWIKIHFGYESSNVLIIDNGIDYESSDVLIIDYGIANSHIMGTYENMKALI
jgi:hypothetical protein